MENCELNLDELMQVNGGNNEAAVYLRSLAEANGCYADDGSIDSLALGRVLSIEDKEKLLLLSESLGLGIKKPKPGPFDPRPNPYPFPKGPLA